MEHTPTALQPADPGAKPTSAPVSFHAYDYATGVRFYAPAYSEHAKLMDLVTYNAAVHSPCLIHPKICPLQFQLPLSGRMLNRMCLPKTIHPLSTWL